MNRTIFLSASLLLLNATAFAAEQPEYSDAAKVLTRYCVGCHNDVDREGDLSLETFASLKHKTERGPLLVPGKASQSRLIKVITGGEPQMPPEGNAAPAPAEIVLLKEWINSGANGPREANRPLMLSTPRVEPSKAPSPITALAWSTDGTSLAVGRFGNVTVLDATTRRPRWRVDGLGGKVNNVEFSADGQTLIAATGIAGLRGQAILFEVKSGLRVRTFEGHRDTLYAAAMSSDGRIVATGSYDRQIILWDAKTGQRKRMLVGHNGAVFDIAFSPDGKTLASASADETVKIWNVRTGERLDTRSEPLAEQYAVAFSPDGRFFLGAGADHRIRVWSFVSREKPAINPLVHARFAHESAVLDIGFSANGKALLSAAEDRTLKVWETENFSQTQLLESQCDVIGSLAVAPDGTHVAVGRMDGSLTQYELEPQASEPAAEASIVSAESSNLPATDLQEHAETEPNNVAKTANLLSTPFLVKGVISKASDRADADLYRFESQAGQQWVVETRAARDKSPADTHIEVLHADGSAVEWVVLRATRDSYFTFRGKDSDIISDFRVHNWQEMELNEFLYSNGEVNRLFMYPRGPDSGFNVYPGQGKRWTYFGTPFNSHALHEPCYIVEPHPPETEFIPNGLPVFPIFYENDDDGLRELGTDSRLIFTAPETDEYLVRVTDTRGFGGDDYKYSLTVRPPMPGFSVKLAGRFPKVAPGSSREFRVEAKRIDGYDGPIRIDVENVPDGFRVTTPLIIEAGHIEAVGTVFASPDARTDKEESTEGKASKPLQAIASANVAGKIVRRSAVTLAKKIELTDPPKVVVQIETLEGTVGTFDKPLELTISPGQSIEARVVVQRMGYEGRLSFGKETAGRNMPHGVYVDNIGLNGLMIVEGQTEREFFITAADWVPETSRLFHLKASEGGGPASVPVLLHVKRTRNVAAAE